MPEEMRFNVLEESLTEKSRTGNYYMRNAQLNILTPFISALTISGRFKFVNKYPASLDLPLEQLKSIFQDKISEAIAHGFRHEQFFDLIKIEIANAKELIDLGYLAEDLNNLLNFNPSNDLVPLDMSSIESHDENEMNHAESTLPLIDLLQSLGLTKEQLSSTALKKSWLTIHPDKTGIELSNFTALKNRIQAIQTVFSITEMTSYHTDADKQKNLTNTLSGLSTEDELFLVQKGQQKLMDFLESSDTDLEFSTVIKGFIQTHIQSQQQGMQSFATTLNALSKAASAFTHLIERNDFRREASYYQEIMKKISCVDKASNKENIAKIIAEQGLFKATVKHKENSNEETPPMTELPKNK
tara:strand:- start:177 stop:1247 length:1071 start_codon:yes stop_codon:yes gene_type:complete